MADYRLISFDMDGTLLNSEQKVTPDTVKAVEQAACAGRLCVLCTGRSVREIRDYLEMLPGMKYAVCCSGSLLYDIGRGEILNCSCIEPETLARMLALSAPEDPLPMLMTPFFAMYRSDVQARIGEYDLEYYRRLFAAIGRYSDDLAGWALSGETGVNKVNLYHHTAESRERTRALLRGLPVEMVNSDHLGLECTAKGVDKAWGLRKLCGLLGVEMADVIAVGDSGNDLPAMRIAGLGIAMGNAEPGVKAAAGAVVADCDHDGCAEAVRKYLLGMPV